MTLEWNPSWGNPEDYGVDTTIEKMDGFSVGEWVIARRDGDEDDGEWWFEGDVGVIIGFCPPSGFRGDAAVIAFESMDPMTVYDLGNFDPVDYIFLGDKMTVDWKE